MNEIKNETGCLYAERDMLVFRERVTGKAVFFSVTDPFVLYVEDSDGYTRVLRGGEFSLVGEKSDENSVEFIYAQGDTEAAVRFSALGRVFVKNVTFRFGRQTFVKRVCLENSSVNAAVRRGGEGQPVFLGDGKDDFMWCGIEFPAAQNGYEGSSLCFTQSPFEKYTEFRALPVVYGMGCSGDIFNEFTDYLNGKLPRVKPLKIYCDWGLHDDLSAEGPFLTEEMSLKNVEKISKFMKETGARFDYYLMDAYWFEKNAPYTSFSRSSFPRGNAAVVKAVENAGMKFGLWFDINCIHAGMTGYEELDTALGNKSLCFSCKRTAELMTQAILKQIRECGIKMIKLDFAYFECKNPDHGHSTDTLESKERSVRNFIEMISVLKKAEPELKVLCYNGWTTSLDWLGSIKKRAGYAVSPYWAEYVDFIYCGDPRPAEIASGNTAASLVWYTDSMIRCFAESALPLTRIDDHGTMLGGTTTIYHLGKALFREGTVLNVMRGGGKLFLYGDISGLDGADAEYWKFVNGIFDHACENGFYPELLRGDIRIGEPYGYSLRSEKEGYSVIVNPLKKDVVYTLSFPCGNYAKTIAAAIIKDGEIIEREEKVFGDAVPVNVSAEGFTLVKWKIVPCGAPFLKTTLIKGEKLSFNVKAARYIEFAFTKNGSPERTPFGIPEGMTVSIDGKPAVSTIERPVWSGVSWLHYDLSENTAVTLEYGGEDAVTVKYHAEEKL
ncbi:MAG: hypothetical protein IJR61_01000 [Clostridia bacterium]|nr:hypothetical protein [Clostridia bacterium]